MYIYICIYIIHIYMTALSDEDHVPNVHPPADPLPGGSPWKAWKKMKGNHVGEHMKNASSYHSCNKNRGKTTDSISQYIISTHSKKNTNIRIINKRLLVYT